MIEALALAWSAVVAATSLRAAGRSLAPSRARARVFPAGYTPPSVLLLRPCAGAEPSLAEALRSSAAAARAAGARVRFAVASRDDGAFPAATAIAGELRASGLDAEVLVTGPSAANAKSGQLAAALRLTPRLSASAEAPDRPAPGASSAAEVADIVAVADSDVLLREGDLTALLQPLADRAVGAAWMPPAEIASPLTLGDRASQAVLSGSLHAFPLLAGIDPGGMVGKLFAVRSSALDDAGGFGALTEILGEDMELARRLRAQGLAVAAVPGVAQSLARGRSARATLDRYARWLQVIRAQRPWLLPSYPLLFAALPLLLLLSLAGLPAWPAAAAAALALGARLLVALCGRRLTHGRFLPVTAMLDVILADALLLAAFGAALTTRELRWRGRKLSLIGGRLALTLVVLLCGLSEAFALPTVGKQGKNVSLEDADGHVTPMEEMLGKPILIVYEDKGSSQQNQAFKDELARLAKGDKYKNKVSLAAVADLTAYNYWPVKGFVKDAIRKESKKFGTTIFCDWTGHVRDGYTFRQGVSSIVLMDPSGKVLFASEGSMSAAQRKKAIDMLRAQVEG
jgi:ceramide glucosyltransferase